MAEDGKVWLAVADDLRGIADGNEKLEINGPFHT